jgi:hypothetical protein
VFSINSNFNKQIKNVHYRRERRRIRWRGPVLQSRYRARVLSVALKLLFSIPTLTRVIRGAFVLSPGFLPWTVNSSAGPRPWYHCWVKRIKPISGKQHWSTPVESDVQDKTSTGQTSRFSKRDERTGRAETTERVAAKEAAIERNFILY